MPTKRRTRRRSLKPPVTDDAVWQFLLLEEIIANGDDVNFEPRGRRREALDAIKRLAQLTGRGWFQHCPCWARSPDPPPYMHDRLQIADWKEAWRLRLARAGGSSYLAAAARAFADEPQVRQVPADAIATLPAYHPTTAVGFGSHRKGAGEFNA
jgi:hypothetical protein